MEGLTYPSTYFRDGAVDLGNVYIIMDPIGLIVGVYKCQIGRASCRERV